VIKDSLNWPVAYIESSVLIKMNNSVNRHLWLFKQIKSIWFDYSTLVYIYICVKRQICLYVTNQQDFFFFLKHHLKTKEVLPLPTNSWNQGL